MNTEFNLSSELVENKLLIKTSGYINNNGGQLLFQEYEKFKDQNPSEVVLDLENTSVVNSIGISYLIEMIENLNDNDGKLFFKNISPAIEKTFVIMGLFQYAQKID
ncbi:MAG: STAS domain-containing protein [Chlorobi bacterium]|nr:STAS domain-containing protein [Chlorobiota bacterium]